MTSITDNTVQYVWKELDQDVISEEGNAVHVVTA